MKDKNGQNRRSRPRSAASEIGEVRIFFNPGPDAEDNLRRAVSLMIKYATRDRQAARGEDAPPHDPNAEGRAQADV